MKPKLANQKRNMDNLSQNNHQNCKFQMNIWLKWNSFNNYAHKPKNNFALKFKVNTKCKNYTVKRLKQKIWKLEK